MSGDQGQVLEMVVQGVEEGEPNDGHVPLSLLTSRGNVDCRYYAAPGARLGAIWVGGAGGDWDSPAHGLYPLLCEEMVANGISSLRVRYREANYLDECTLDVLAGIDYLERAGVEATALTGHSFGGAVVIQAAASSPTVRTVVTLATQSYGTGPAATLAPRCSILLIHGADDHVLPPASSEYVYRLAQEPKRVVILPHAGHGLDSVAAQVRSLVRDWIVEQLRRPPTPPG